MYKNWMFLKSLIIFLLTLVVVACSATTNPQNLSTSIASPPANQASAKKVVALTPLTADIIYQLDQTKLVGVAGSKLISDDPRFKQLTPVSGEQTPPNLEKIVALKPNLVVGAAGFHDRTMEKLQQLGIETLLTKVDSWKSLEELTVNLARSLDANPEALLKRYQSFLADIPNQNYSTLILASSQPILSPNKFSWAGDLLVQFKTKNLAAELQGTSAVRGYITLSAEKILQANPDLILLINREPDILDKFKADPFWNQLQAVKNNRVYLFEYYGLINPGSIDSIEKACTQLKQVLATKI
jgi:iron complex transport system substrate-binding protein